MIKNPKGFSLLEVMLATILIVIGIVGIISVMSSGMVSTSSTDGRRVALRLAQEELETIKDDANTSFTHLESYQQSYTAIGSSTGPFYHYKMQVLVTSISSGGTQVTVNIQWPFKSGNMTVSLTTLINAPTTTSP